MKSLLTCLLTALLFISANTNAQTVSGKWYGVGNASTEGASNNYLVELILVQKGNVVTGEFNYYFKSGYFPNKITGRYDPKTRKLSIKTIPVTYHRSAAVNGVECSMDGDFTLLISKAGSALKGRFVSTDFYALTCPDIIMNLTFSDEKEKQKDEIIIEEKKVVLQQEKQIDRVVPVTPVAFRELSQAEIYFPQRKNVDMGVIEVDSDELAIELIDNGEVDRDSVSIFYNNRMLANRLELSRRGIVYHITLDERRFVNEISMFAENLGFIPPNTATLIVHDGKKRHEINLTSTLQTNGTVRIKKRESTP